MKYLKKFDTETNIQVSSKPNVVLGEDTGKISYNVEVINGVYIQHINGNLFTIDEWKLLINDNDKANGVAVINDNARFVMAKKDAYGGCWANASDNISGILTTSKAADAKKDYLGVSNTNAIIAKYPNEGNYYCVAIACANFLFPNGSNGYLPALGELAIAYNYKTEIDAAITLIGGTTLVADLYWSSTQYSHSSAWQLSWANGEISSKDKKNPRAVRPFMAI